MEEYIYDKKGVRRKAIISNCRFCKKDFLHRPRWDCKFCSRVCSVSYRSIRSKENKIHIKCESCGKDIETVPSRLKASRHNAHFCSRLCKEKEQKLTGKCDRIKPKRYGKGWGYRFLCTDKLKNGCECGEKREFLLLVHHIDSNRKNRSIENLEVVCANCHMIRHLYWNGSKWKFSMKVLTPREKIPEIRGLGLHGVVGCSADSKQMGSTPIVSI